MKLFLTILTTALISGFLTFMVTKNWNKAEHSGPHITFRVPSFHFTGAAHPYPVAQAVQDIITFQNNVDSIYSVYERAIQGLPIRKPASGLPQGFTKGLLGYTINSEDLINSLGVVYDTVGDSVRSTYHAVRVYIGFSIDSQRYKMFVVPVSSITDPVCKCSNTGKDYLFRPIKQGDYIVDTSLTPDLNQDVVMDLISPCPTICDTASPLINSICRQQAIPCNNKNGK